MAAFNLITFDTANERNKRRDSSGITIDFTSVQIGASNLPITEGTAGRLDINGVVLEGVASPINGTDAANKDYVDGVAQGLDVKHSVKAGTTAALPAVTAAGSGVGKTLTADANGALTIDGVSTWVDIDNDGGLADPFSTSGTLASRALLKNQVLGDDNGIYAVKDKGSASTPFILIRSEDLDEDANITAGAFTFIEEGATYADTGYVLTTNDPITIDVTSQSWSQFSGAGAFSGGDGINISGTVIEVDLATDSGLEFSTAQLRVLVDVTETSTTLASALRRNSTGLSVAVDDSTLEGSGQGAAGAESLRVKDLGITTAKLASTSVTAAKLGSDVAGDGLTGGNGSAIAALANVTETLTTEASSIIVGSAGISVSVDDSTIEGSGQGAAGTETLRVKDLGITTAKLASLSVTAAKLGSDVAGDGLTGGNGSAIAALANITETLTTEASSILVAAAGISISVDDSTIEGSGQGVAGTETLRVKAAGITETQLNTSVAGGGLAGGGGTALSVNTGDGIQIVSDAVAADYSDAFTNDNGGAITIRQIVYIKANGAVDLAKNDVTDLDNFEIGVVEDASIASAASGEIFIRRGAVIAGFSGLTPGAKQYVSDATAGALTESLSGFVATEFVYTVGRAKSATELIFDPHFEFEF